MIAHFSASTRLLTLLLSLFISLIEAGCSPQFHNPGPAIQPAHLSPAHFVAADGAVLPVRAWLPKEGSAKAVIVALHGFNDYSRFFQGAGEYLSRQGIACYAYDQRGFGMAPANGTWAGLDAYVADLRNFVAQARLRHPGAPVYVLGESMGGAVGIVAMASENPPQADGLILTAPAVWGRSTMPWYQRVLLEALAHTLPESRFTGEGLKILASDNIEMLRQLGRDPRVIKATRVDAIYGLVDLMDAALAESAKLNADTLVLYGEKDQVVPKKPIALMLQAMEKQGHTQVVVYPNGYHLLLRDLQAETAWRDIAAWVANPKQSLPSGQGSDGLLKFVQGESGPIH